MPLHAIVGSACRSGHLPLTWQMHWPQGRHKAPSKEGGSTVQHTRARLQLQALTTGAWHRDVLGAAILSQTQLGT